MTMKDKTIGFIGAGNMANAIISGILLHEVTLPQNIFVYDIDKEKCDKLGKKGISVCRTLCDVLTSSQYTVLAVKPQNYEEVLKELSKKVTEDKIFVSIAAGISIEYIQKTLNCSLPVVRVMPNTPVLLGKGASALSKSGNISEEDFDFVKSLFALSGVAEELPESLMNTVIAVNGSSPAYIYLFAKAMIDYACENGIPHDAALNLVCASLEGSAAMLRESGDTPEILIKKVCSPGGTTIEAVNTLNEYSFYDAVKKAMDSCTKRAEEIGK